MEAAPTLDGVNATAIVDEWFVLFTGELHYFRRYALQ